MNYEDMSDHEVNMAVTCIENNCQGWSITAANTGFYHCGVDGSGFYEVECVDYCNNPSDAWPIIVENGICLTSPTIGRKHQLWSASWNEDGGRWSCGDITHADKNPLRAAMICFLKMKDAEK